MVKMGRYLMKQNQKVFHLSFSWEEGELLRVWREGSGVCARERQELCWSHLNLGLIFTFYQGLGSLMIISRYNGRGVPSGVVLHYVVDLLAIEDGVLDDQQEVVHINVRQIHICDSRNVKGRQKKNHFIEDKTVFKILVPFKRFF